MQITIISITNKIPATVRQLCDQYNQRMTPDTVVWRYVTPGQGNPENAKRQESNAVLQLLNAKHQVILLDERGKLLDSVMLAEHINKWKTHRNQLVFIIGGAYGVDQLLYERADFVWSLSPLVFPHQLVQIMLSEQLYRAQAINAGHPYHHA